MKKLSSAKIAFVMFGIMTFACVSGSIGGTLAWYAYSGRALVSYTGTSVSETALLQIGICSDVALTGMPTGVSSVTYPGDSNYYYFADPGKGMTYDIIAKYLTAKSYATNSLEPTTSGSYSSYSDEEAFSLKQAPSEMERGNTVAAYKKDYLTIPFVFRVQGEGSSFYDGRELWLTKAVARASTSSDGEVYKAIRVFVDRDAHNYGAWKEQSNDYHIGDVAPEGDLGHAYYLKSTAVAGLYDLYIYDSGLTNWNLVENSISLLATAPDCNQYAGNYYLNSNENKLYRKTSKDFIVNPSASNKGKTRVGGLLNKARDEYFDFDNNGEILFGEYDAAALDLISDTGYAGANTVRDVNGVGNTTPSTFVAKHPTGMKYYADIASHDSLFGHAEYESISSIAPERDSQDRLRNVDANNPTSVCKTVAADHYLGRVNLTVYLEGWDFSVVDKERSHSFDLGLTFEMSRL